MKASNFFQKVLIGTFLSLLVGQVNAQLYLVSGTNFEVPGSEAEAYTGLWDIEHIGLIKPTITTAEIFYGPNATQTVYAQPCRDIRFFGDAPVGANFLTGRYFAVTNNPSKISSSLYNNNDAYWGFVMSPFTGCNGNSSVLRFKVPGLRPGAAVRVEVEYCIAATGTLPAGGPELRVAFNGDDWAYGNYASSMLGGAGTTPTFTPRAPGGCGTIIASSGGAGRGVIPPSGELDLSIAASSGANMPIVIKSIRIFSIVDAKVSGAAEVCAGGERSLLSVSDVYSDEGVSYQWFRNNVLIPGATGRTFMHLTGPTANVNYSYHFTMTVPVAGSAAVTTTSATFSIRDILCCMDEFGNPTSRKLIWQDDFGTFDGPNTYWYWDYSDISNPKKVYQPPTRDVWRAPILHYNIPGGPCAASPCGEGCVPRRPWAEYHPGPVHPLRQCGNFMEGYYMVAARIAGHVNLNPSFADLGWAGAFGNTPGPYFPDNTYGFEGNGGMLLINLNCNANETIYQRVLDNLCNTTVTVKCFIGCFVGGNNPRIYVRVTETGTGPGTSYPLNQARSQTITAGAPGTWREVSVQLTLNYTRSMTFEIISEIGGTAININGNDFMMDDIQVWACATPMVELFSNPDDYRAIIKSCKGNGFEMFVDESPMLLTYYGDQLGYIYQYNMKNPDDADFKTSWVNINNTPVNETSITNLEYIFTAFKAALAAAGRSEEGARMQFRVVAGRRLALIDAISKGIPFNPDDPCKEVSIAEPVIVELDCSCPTPRTVVISASRPIANKTISACPGETVTLTVTPNLSGSAQAQWFDENPVTTANPTLLHTGISYNAVQAEIGGQKTYYLKVISLDEPEEAGCWRTDNVTVRVNILPPALGDVLDICLENQTPTAADNIPFSFKSTYADGSYLTGQNLPSKFLPYRTKDTTTPLSDTIQIGAGAANASSGTIYFRGDQVEVDVTGQDPVYHIYLEDETLVQSQGILLPGAMSSSSSVGSNSNTRILLQVTQEVILESVSIFPRRQGGGGGATASTTVTPVLYVCNADGTVGATTNLTAAQGPFTYYNDRLTEVNVNLGNRVLTPGRYYLGFTYSGAPDRMYFNTSPVNAAPNNYIFTTRFPDNIQAGGLALYGIGSRTGTNASNEYIISDLKFTTLVKNKACDRIRISTRYVCAECDRPDVVEGKRAEITVPAGTRQEYGIVQLCNDESVTLSVRRLQLNGNNAGTTFDILWYQEGNPSHFKSVNADTDSHTVTAWTLNNPNVAETRKYYIKVQDKATPLDDKCWVWDSISVRVNPTPTVNKPADQTKCVGITTDLVTFTGNNVTGVVYNWTNSNRATGLNADNGTGNIAPFMTTNTTTSAISSTITVTPTVNGCIGTPESFTITVNPVPTVNKPDDQEKCVGEQTDLVTFSGNNVAGVTYNWTNSNTAIGLGGIGNGNITPFPTASNSTTSPVSGMISVVPSTANCQGERVTFTITVNPLPTPVITKSLDIETLTCINESINLTASGGTSYLWNAAASNATTALITITGAGAYEVEVTDANGCKAKTQVTMLLDKTPPTVSIAQPDATMLTCEIEYIDLTATSPNSGTFSWTNSSGGVVGSDATLTVIAPGTYTVTMTSSTNGCTNTASQSITQAANMPSVSISPDIFQLTCNTEDVTLTAVATGGTGTYSYLWNTGATAGAINVTVDDITTSQRNYTVTITDGNGCKANAEAVVTKDVSLPVITFNNILPICVGDAITLTASGADSYVWTPAPGLNVTTGANVTVNPDQTTTYIVTGTKTANGCVNTAQIEVTVNTLPTISVDNAEICYGNSTVLTAYGATSYIWSPADGLSETTGANVTANPTADRTYTIEGTDLNGCKNTTTATVKVNTLPTVTVNSPSICYGSSTTLTASGASAYIWSPADGLGSIDGANATVNPTVQTTYTVEGTDGKNCKNTATATVTVNPLPIAGITKDPDTDILTCATGSIQLTATGGIEFLWSTGAVTETITVSSTGDYEVTVTDENRCENKTGITINADEAMPTAGITNPANKTTLTCETTSITLTATGNGTYSWTNRDGTVLETTATLTVTKPGIYTVTVTADNNCTDAASIEITEDKEDPIATIENLPNKTELTCETPSITLTAGGGGTYSWKNQDGTDLGTNATLPVTAKGTYTVTVKAANGCTNDASITITENKIYPTVNINSSANTLTCTAPVITLTATGGGDYKWNNGEQTSSITVDKADTYTVTVTAGNGCVTAKSITIYVNTSPPAISITTSPATTILTCATPSITLTADGGSSYVWNNGLETSSISVDKAGTYSVTGTALNGCSNTQSITITADQSSPTITVNAPEICLGDEAILIADGADSYIWSTGATGSNITVSPTALTSYTVEGTVAKTGCKNSTTVTVYVETPLILTLVSTPESVELGGEITLNVYANGPEHNDYNWFLNNNFYETTAANSITLEPAAGRQLFRVETKTTDLNCFASTEDFYVIVTETMPNAINPYNPSGANCCFMKASGNRPGYRVEIYNRYMQKVFEGDDGWDGTYRGTPADPGTYFYRLFKKSGEVEKGTLEIVKF